MLSPALPSLQQSAPNLPAKLTKVSSKSRQTLKPSLLSLQAKLVQHLSKPTAES